MTASIITEKYCPRCSQSKPLNEFGNDASSKDNLSFYCTECSRAIDRARNPTPRRRAGRAKAFHKAKGLRPRKMTESKYCKYCDTEKPAAKFAYSPQMKDGMKSKCLDCERPARIAYVQKVRAQKRAEDPIKFRISRRGNHCKRYGLAEHEFWQMNEKQNGKCAICGYAPDPAKRFLDVDHDHSIKGRRGVRALLCGNCNAGIGHFRDSAALCEKAADYIRQHKLVV